MARLTVWTGALVLLHVPVSAQYIGGRAPEPPPSPMAGTLESPEAALARNVRLLAINPRNYEALLGAGRAALRLGDAQAAIGFFGRAEEVNSAHWAPKAGQGSALAQMGEGAAALGMFEQAQGLGATQSLLALDRGLAFDLLGRQAEAQSDYRAVLAGADEAESRRRLSLSLAISGRKADALAALDPLLARRDPGARRARAFILALSGDVEGARQAIGALLPGSAAGFDPFLRRLPTLGPGQKAAAVHLGMMPAEGTALAYSEPRGAVPGPQTPSSVPTPSAVAPTISNTRVAAPVRVDARPSEPPVTPPVRIASATPQLVMPVPNTTRLADIETTLGQLPSEPVVAPPPAPRPIVERPVTRRLASASRNKVSDNQGSPPSDQPARTAKVSSVAEKSKKSDDKPVRLAANDKGKKAPSASADGKAKEEKGARSAGASRIYVQLAGGANADRMSNEFSRIRARKSALFRARQPLVSEVRGWARLLVGPFADPDTAQAFVNDLHEAKLEGFVWTAPIGTKFEKLAVK